MESLLTVEELARSIRKSVASIRSDVSRKPQSLPPICRLPGTKRLLWRKCDVDTWLAQYVQTFSVVTPPISDVKTSEVIRRRGRPTKAEQFARLAAEAAATTASRGA